MASHSIKDKVIMITGAAGGFGKAMAETFAPEGAHLVLTDINAEGLADTVNNTKAAGVTVVSGQHDVGSESDWAAIMSEVESTFGKLDALVNNAGYMLTKPYMNTTLEEFQNIHRVNVESIWIGVQAAYNLLKAGADASEGGSASVVNLSSVYGQVAGLAQSAYCATKGAVRTLTKAQAVEFAQSGVGIRVNSVHPGPGNTNLAANAVGEMIAAGMVKTEEEAMGLMTSMIPAGRFAEAEDVADLMMFLCSDASRYFTGSEFTLDGGYTAI